MKSQSLLLDLIEATRLNINEVEKLKSNSLANLNTRAQKTSWTVLECIEHLNRYGQFYIPELKKVISKSGYKTASVFKGSWLGRFFISSIDPNKKTKNMKTPKEMNPFGSVLGIEVLDTFLSQQHELLEILDQAKKVSLDKTKTKISLSKFIKLRLGETLKFLVLHNQRHINQAKKVLANVGD